MKRLRYAALALLTITSACSGYSTGCSTNACYDREEAAMRARPDYAALTRPDADYKPLAAAVPAGTAPVVPLPYEAPSYQDVPPVSDNGAALLGLAAVMLAPRPQYRLQTNCTSVQNGPFLNTTCN